MPAVTQTPSAREYSYTYNAIITTDEDDTPQKPTPSLFADSDDEVVSVEYSEYSYDYETSSSSSSTSDDVSKDDDSSRTASDLSEDDDEEEYDDDYDVVDVEAYNRIMARAKPAKLTAECEPKQDGSLLISSGVSSTVMQPPVVGELPLFHNAGRLEEEDEEQAEILSLPNRFSRPSHDEMDPLARAESGGFSAGVVVVTEESDDAYDELQRQQRQRALADALIDNDSDNDKYGRNFIRAFALPLFLVLLFIGINEAFRLQIFGI